MKLLAPLSLLAIAATAALSACDDTTTGAGASLVTGQTEIIIDSAFTATGHAVANTQVQSRTTLQLLGRIQAKGYGALRSDIICQYMPSDYIDTVGVKEEYIDSVKLILAMYRGAFAGDSVMPMGLEIHELTKDLPAPIFSDFDPAGYYNPQVIAATTYAATLDGAPGVYADNSKNLYRSYSITLPREIGVRLYNAFKKDPAAFNTPQSFHPIFRGLYITTSFGSGRVTRFTNNMINVHYRSVQPIPNTTPPRDTTLYGIGTYLGVTPEVVTNNDISYTIDPALEARAQAGEPILVGPLGYEVEMHFPAADILRAYQDKSGPLAVVNTLTFSLPVKTIENDYGLTPPPYILMVKKNEKEKFFSSGKINDNISSFYAPYNSSTRTYEFSNMRDYILDIIDKGQAGADDEEFVIVPALVSVTYNSDYYGGQTAIVESITPYITEPVMGLLDFENAKIKFTFAKQTLGN